jgi:hypothetical protein
MKNGMTFGIVKLGVGSVTVSNIEYSSGALEYFDPNRKKGPNARIDLYVCPNTKGEHLLRLRMSGVVGFDSDSPLISHILTFTKDKLYYNGQALAYA